MLDKQNKIANPTQIDYRWPLLFLAYFSLQILSRTIVGGGLGIDEAELMLTAQTLKWGYGTQPPLYSWIQYGLFSLFGETIFSLSLLKNSFLCLTYLALFRLLRDHYNSEIAGLATLSLLLLPQIGWESQRALSHSVLATTMASVTLLLFFRLMITRNLWLYFLLGIAVALGVLSKFNFVLLPIALLISAISLRSTRGAIINPRIILSFVTTSIILFMPVQWMISHQKNVLETASKFNIHADTEKTTSTLIGLLSLVKVSFLFSVVPLIILIILYLRYHQKSITSSSQELPIYQFLLRTVISALLLTLVIVLCSGTTNVKDRWLLPFLFLTAPTMTLWFLPKLSKLGRHRFIQAIGIAALLVFIAQPIHDMRPSRRSTPFPAIVSAIADKYPETKTIYAENKWIGGNFHYLNKNWNIIIPGKNPDALEGEVVLVWPSRQATIPQVMTGYLEAQNKKITVIDPTTTVKIAYSPKFKSLFTINFTAAQIKNSAASDRVLKAKY